MNVSQSTVQPLEIELRFFLKVTETPGTKYIKIKMYRGRVTDLFAILQTVYVVTHVTVVSFWIALCLLI